MKNNLKFKNFYEHSNIDENEEINSENCLIEQLRIELEKLLGFTLFKNVYNIIDDNV